MYEVFQQLLNEHGITAYRVAKDTGISTATLTQWKKGISTPKLVKLQKIADYFGVSIEYLMTGIDFTTNKESQCNIKNEKDIKDIISHTKQLLKQDGLMLDGKPASSEAIDCILVAIQIGLEMAKKKNK